MRNSNRDFAQMDAGKTRSRIVRKKSSDSRVRESRPRPPQSRKRTWTLRILRWGIVSGLVTVVLAIVGYWGLVFYFEHRLPDIFEPEDYLAMTAQVTRVYSADGEVLAELGDERRTVVAEEDIPKLVKDAVLAAEDADFYDHDGLDYFGMARAMYKNVRDGRFSQGASTITQQVAKTFFLSSEKTLSRKLKEVVLARRLEQKLTKDELLYLYLNQIYWGHGRFGAGEAARFYFRKDLKALTLADAALLAGLIAAPERYSPFKDKDKAIERRAFVLDQMAHQGFIDARQAHDAKHEPIRLNFRQDPFLGAGGYAVDMVRRFLVEQFGSEVVRGRGLRVYTTIDTRIQGEAERALRSGLESVDAAYDLATPLERLERQAIAPYIRRLAGAAPGSGIRSGTITLGVVTGVDREAEAYRVHVGPGPCRLPFDSVKRYAGLLEPGRVFQVGDVIRVSPRHDLATVWTDTEPLPVLNIDQGPQGALVALDPTTRHVKALVGGYDHETHPFNRAEQARRQAGSTFKPIVFGAALESGIIDPLTELRNVPESYRMGNGRYWKPGNFSGRYDGKMYTARMALAKSINVIAVKVLEKAGTRRVIDFARRIGIESEITNDYSIALGSTAVSPYELANAYATFASGGFMQKPVLVTRVEDHHGNLMYEAPGERRRGTPSKIAYRLTEMMETVVEHGTGVHARSIGRPAAGKTGTTDHGIDTWFAGYTPELVATVWIGFDDRRPVEKATGGHLAAPVWARFVTAALEGRPVRRFDAPPGVEALPAVNELAMARPPVEMAGEEDAPGGEEQPDTRTSEGGAVDLLYE